MTTLTFDPADVQVTFRGQIPDELRAVARREIAKATEVTKGPVLSARVVVKQETAPRIECPTRAEAEVVLPGRTVRARSVAASPAAAVDDVAERLRDRISRSVDRLVSGRRVPAEHEPGGWRHANLSPPRPQPAMRPVGERTIVRRKSFALGPLSEVEAAAELVALDHDFFLFRDLEADCDAVIYRARDGRLRVIVADPAKAGELREPTRLPDPIDLARAVAEMDAVDHRFIFFANVNTGRGNVIYRRYDGNYGLIEPADL